MTMLNADAYVFGGFHGIFADDVMVSTGETLLRMVHGPVWVARRTRTALLWHVLW